MFTSPAFIIGIVFMLIGLAVSQMLKSKFNKYSKIPLSTNLSGKEIAEKMLKQHGIYDVKVESVPGKLTDHYNPLNKTVNLSPEVYEGRNAAAAAIAAHECGHAVQHATAYSMLKLRSALVPLQNASGKIINIIVMVSIFGGYFLYNAIPFDIILYVIIAAYAVITTFSLVTLPVEFDASNRALVWIRTNGIVNSSEYDNAKDALKWAASTYVVAAIGSLATLMYYVSLLGRRD
ncbi:MAG: zinc metallopeptidase [Flavobacteriales bacterium]|jgi:Zn-dependent membrane protease YugP|nr:zinc metallopeptidase [Flavobacteriales bacterium]